MRIVEGSLEVIEIFNGYALYGVDSDGNDAFIAHLGDGVDSFVSDSAYNPNDDIDLSEAYDFEVMPFDNYLVSLI